jgi:protein-S-isoprenylcysteine O-methyltransferase Ste14
MAVYRRRVSHLPTVLSWLLVLTGALWAGVEIAQGLRSRPGARRARFGGRVVVVVPAVIGAALALYLANVVSSAAVSNRTAAAWCGLVVLWAAFALRIWSFRTLGRYFTFDVQTSADQTIVTTGPYRFVRHPGYSALLLAAIAGGLLMGNWLSLVVFVGAVTTALVVRITVEERALQQDVGTAYRPYAATHKRLVPYLW